MAPGPLHSWHRGTQSPLRPWAPLPGLRGQGSEPVTSPWPCRCPGPPGETTRDCELHTAGFAPPRSGGWRISSKGSAGLCSPRRLQGRLLPALPAPQALVSHVCLCHHVASPQRLCPAVSLSRGHASKQGPRPPLPPSCWDVLVRPFPAPGPPPRPSAPQPPLWSSGSGLSSGVLQDGPALPGGIHRSACGRGPARSSALHGRPLPHSCPPAPTPCVSWLCSPPAGAPGRAAAQPSQAGASGRPRVSPGPSSGPLVTVLAPSHPLSRDWATAPSLHGAAAASVWEGARERGNGRLVSEAAGQRPRQLCVLCPLQMCWWTDSHATVRPRPAGWATPCVWRCG